MIIHSFKYDVYEEIGASLSYFLHELKKVVVSVLIFRKMSMKKTFSTVNVRTKHHKHHTHNKNKKRYLKEVFVIISQSTVLGIGNNKLS